MDFAYTSDKWVTINEPFGELSQAQLKCTFSRVCWLYFVFVCRAIGNETRGQSVHLTFNKFKVCVIPCLKLWIH
jgi:hypothetical protein